MAGFVDDWSAGCGSFAVLGDVFFLVGRFKAASGQQINRLKSAVVPSRRLSQQEVARCYEQWAWHLRVSYCERLLGIFLGLDADIEKQYEAALEKLEETIAV